MELLTVWMILNGQKKTQHKVREHLLTFEVESDKLVSKFIKETQIKFLQ